MKGRPRKQGKRRYTNGAIVRKERDPATVFDQGTERIRALRNRYGEHYSTGLGRAYVAGLLGEGQLAKDRLEAGKHFAATYRRVFGRTYRCALNDTPRGAFNYIESNRARRVQQWLYHALDTLEQSGHRPCFDQLMQDGTEGPHWLDRLLVKQGCEVDRVRLAAAVAALDMLTPERKPLGIRVSHA